MPPRIHRQKVSKRLAVASALLLLLIFVVKEILKDNLKELHDSIASAESQFRTEEGQSTISAQILVAQEQTELDRLKSSPDRNRPHRDFSSLIVEDTAQAKQAKSDLNADFDSVSRLIDKLPSGARDLRQLRDQVRQHIDTTDRRITDALKPEASDDDLYRFVKAKMALLFALTDEIGVTMLGDAALTRAQRAEAAQETIIRVCSWILYALTLTLLSLGVYAALTGTKKNSTD